MGPFIHYWLCMHAPITPSSIWLDFRCYFFFLTFVMKKLFLPFCVSTYVYIFIYIFVNGRLWLEQLTGNGYAKYSSASRMRPSRERITSFRCGTTAACGKTWATKSLTSNDHTHRHTHIYIQRERDFQIIAKVKLVISLFNTIVSEGGIIWAC